MLSLVLLFGNGCFYSELNVLTGFFLFVGLVTLSLTCCAILFLTLSHLDLGCRSPLSSLNVHHNKALTIDLLRLEDLS